MHDDPVNNGKEAEEAITMTDLIQKVLDLVDDIAKKSAFIRKFDKDFDDGLDDTVESANMALEYELELGRLCPKLARALRIALTALDGYAYCGYDSRSFDDGLLTFNARQALAAIDKELGQ